VPQGWETLHAPSPEAISEAVSAVVERYDSFRQAARRRAVEKFDVKSWLDRHDQIFFRSGKAFRTEMTPRVSIVMPMHNNGTYVRAAVESMLCQTLGDFEFIIVDDASTDNSMEVVRSFSDKRIVFLEERK